MTGTSRIEQNSVSAGMNPSEYMDIAKTDMQGHKTLVLFEELHKTLVDGKKGFIPHENIPGVLRKA